MPPRSGADGRRPAPSLDTQTARRRSGAPGRRSSAGSLSSTSSRLSFASLACSRATSSARVPWPGADRFEEHPVLVLCDDEELVLAAQRRLRREQGAGRGERQRHGVCDRPSERVALREDDERPVVLVVQLDVSLEARPPLADDGVELLGDGDEAGELGRRLEPLGREPRGGAFEHAAELDRIRDVAQREGAHDEPSAGKRAEQPFVGERREGQTERRARDAEPLREPDLRHALLGRQLTREDQLAQPERRPGRLRAGCVAARHGLHPIACSSRALPGLRRPSGHVLHARRGASQASPHGRTRGGAGVPWPSCQEITGFRRTPMPSISASITSPGFR